MIYVIAIRRRFGEVAKHTTDLLPHEPLKAPHVHETTLCVAFGAPRLVTNFRVPTRCAKCSMICMVLRTRVSETTLCVTFGARRRWVPLSLLDRLLASGPPRLPKNSGPVPADGRFGCRGRPEMLVSTLTSADLRSGILRRRGRHAHVVA